MNYITRHAKLKKRKATAPQIIALGFIALILCGTLLLNTTIASKTGQRVGFLTALFTATSSVCVTGLTVVNISQTYSGFGHTVILLLIEMGGLGFMTVSTALAIILRRRITYKDRIRLREQMNVTSSQGIINFLITVLKFTLTVEGVAALLLATRLIPRYGWAKGAWYAIFHAVSAFCNAGIDLFGSSLMGFQYDPIVTITIALTIITGGLGFVVWKDILDKKTRIRRYQLQTKVVLSMTLILIGAGTLIFSLLEWNNPGTIGAIQGPGKLMAAAFQSVSARTAGFNSVNIGNLTDASAFFMIILMFIGAGSGSTGGGVKINTFGVLFYTTLSVIKGYEDVNIFGRRLSSDIIRKSITIFLTCLFLVVSVIFLISMIEDFHFMQISFEVVSAFGTVGSSQGITPLLKPITQLIIITTMFIGRLGPLTLIYALTTKITPRNYRNAEGHINVG